jgi:hypothetical protein
VNNPAAGKEHKFVAYRHKGAVAEKVTMRPPREIVAGVTEAAEGNE